MQVTFGICTMTTGTAETIVIGVGLGDGDGDGVPPVLGAAWVLVLSPTSCMIGSRSTTMPARTTIASTPSSTGTSGNFFLTGLGTASCSRVASAETGGAPSELSWTLKACGCGGPS